MKMWNVCMEKLKQSPACVNAKCLKQLRLAECPFILLVESFSFSAISFPLVHRLTPFLINFHMYWYAHLISKDIWHMCHLRHALNFAMNENAKPYPNRFNQLAFSSADYTWFLRHDAASVDAKITQATELLVATHSA